MNVFWSAKPLAAQQAKLLNLLLAAHAEAATRDNISTTVLRNVAIGNGTLPNAIAAALTSVGGVHAPLQQAYTLLHGFDPDHLSDLARHVELGGRIPGWGSDFIKGEPDPLFTYLDAHLAEHWPDLHARITRITDELHARSKLIHPNMACYTAAVAIVIDLPAPLIAWLFVQGRLSAWSRDFYNTIAAYESRRQRVKEGVMN